MKKSCKSANQEHPKICKHFGKIKNKTRGLTRNFVPRSRNKLFERKHLKRRKNREFGPRHTTMRLGHGHWGTHMRLEHVLCVPCIQNVWGESVFSCFFMGKARFFNPNPGGNSHYKYQPSLFRIPVSVLEQFKSKAILGAYKGVSIFSFFF